MLERGEGVLRRLLIVPLALAAALAGGAVRRVQDQCGPFTDVSPLFCPYVLEAYYTGITAGTSPTTFSPDTPITRGQAAVFVTKGLNQALARGSRRAALGRWWTTTPHWDIGMGVTTVGSFPRAVACDGSDVWVTNFFDNTVSRVRASDGVLLETWTGVGTASQAESTLIAMGKVLALSGGLDGGDLYTIDPSQPAGAATLVANIGNGARSMAFDGSRVFVTNAGGLAGDVYLSIVTPGSAPPWAVQKIHDASHSLIGSLLFDGANMWLAGSSLLRLDAAGAVVQEVPIGGTLASMAYDGSNLWIAGSAGLMMVQASTGTVVATLSGNGLNSPVGVAFDGERMLATNAIDDTVSLFRAADLAPLGSFPAGTSSIPNQACSDGINFWVTLSGKNQLARY